VGRRESEVGGSGVYRQMGQTDTELRREMSIGRKKREGKEARSSTCARLPVEDILTRPIGAEKPNYTREGQNLRLLLLRGILEGVVLMTKNQKKKKKKKERREAQG